MRGHGLLPDEIPTCYAISRFINGTPRLAAAIGLSLLDGEALEAAETLRRMAVDLTAYYKKRFEDLSPMARELFGLMVEVGQPTTQADLTRLAGYASGNAISGPFRELKDELLFVSRSEAASAASLLQISDSIMAFWYAMRADIDQFGDASIQILLEYMVDFYSHREWEKVAQAAVSPAHRRMAQRIQKIVAIRQPVRKEGIPYLALAFESTLIDLSTRIAPGNARFVRKAIKDLVEARFGAVRIAANVGLAGGGDPAKLFWSIMASLADGLDGDNVTAETALESAAAATSDRSSALLATSILASYQWNVTRNEERSTSTMQKIAACKDVDLDEDAIIEVAYARAFIEMREERYSSALKLALKAATHARRSKRWSALANLLRMVSYGQARLDNFAAAISAAIESIRLARTIDASRILLLSLSQLGTVQIFSHLDDAVASLSEAVELSGQLGAEGEKADNLTRLAVAHLRACQEITAL